MKRKSCFRNAILYLLLVGVMMSLVGCLFAGRGDEPPTSPEKNVLFEDNFDDGLKSEWGTFSQWTLPTVQAGKVVITNKQEGPIIGMSNTSWTDYIVEVEVSVEGSVPTGGASFYNCPQIVFRASKPEGDWGDFYLLALWDNRIQLYKRVDGKMVYTQQVGHFLDGVVLGTKPLRVQVKLQANNIGVKVNGHECIDYTDTEKPLTFGGVGVQSWQVPPDGAKWIFDDFIVYEEI